MTGDITRGEFRVGASIKGVVSLGCAGVRRCVVVVGQSLVTRRRFIVEGGVGVGVVVCHDRGFLRELLRRGGRVIVQRVSHLVKSDKLGWGRNICCRFFVPIVIR